MQKYNLEQTSWFGFNHHHAKCHRIYQGHNSAREMNNMSLQIHNLCAGQRRHYDMNASDLMKVSAC